MIQSSSIKYVTNVYSCTFGRVNIISLQSIALSACVNRDDAWERDKSGNRTINLTLVSPHMWDTLRLNTVYHKCNLEKLLKASNLIHWCDHLSSSLLNSVIVLGAKPFPLMCWQKFINPFILLYPLMAGIIKRDTHCITFEHRREGGRVWRGTEMLALRDLNSSKEKDK